MAGAYDVLVVGAGMVGSAIAYGCARGGARTLLIDQDELAPRAARANAGLIWSQGKGDGMPAYAAWTRASLTEWAGLGPGLARSLGRDIGYRQGGGISFCVGAKEFEERSRLVQRMHNQSGGPATAVRMIKRAELEMLLPGVALGPDVTGASYAPADGEVNPLLLLQGLHSGFDQAGGVRRSGRTVRDVTPFRDGFILDLVGGRAGSERVGGEKLVIACGLGIPGLAKQVGLVVPVHPVRGQMIVTERVAPLLPLPCSGVRQTAEGSLQIGTTYEEGVADPVTSVADLARMAARAVAVIPAIAAVPVVRSWAGIRPMTPDGFPIYAQSSLWPGAFAAVCHSGVTLAAAHAGPLVRGILAGALPAEVAALGPGRFAA